MKILVVDDSTTMLRILSNTLKRVCPKAEITKAENGKLAYEAYSKVEGDFDLIVTDWNMPEMNGLQFVKKIRSENEDIPIIMVTTEGGKAEVITALKAGVNNYIVKPFTPQVLKEKLEAIIG